MGEEPKWGPTSTSTDAHLDEPISIGPPTILGLAPANPATTDPFLVGPIFSIKSFFTEH